MRSLPLFVAFALACAGSHTLDPDASRDSDAAAPLLGPCEGDTLPASLVDNYAIHPFECRASSRSDIVGLLLSIDATGRVWLGIPDGPNADGELRCEAGAWVFRVEDPRYAHFELALRASTESRVALTLESVDPARPWRAWAVPYAEEPREDPIELPMLAAACARREVWSLETHDGVALAEGERTPTGSSLPQLKLRNASAVDGVSIWDPSIERGMSGWAVAWNGRDGVARTTPHATVCTSWDDSFTFARRGDVWTVDIRWRVPDVDDLDRDGDREDELVRVSRYELTSDACR
jgi:hypothetical protein